MIYSKTIFFIQLSPPVYSKQLLTKHTCSGILRTMNTLISNAIIITTHTTTIIWTVVAG